MYIFLVMLLKCASRCKVLQSVVIARPVILRGGGGWGGCIALYRVLAAKLVPTADRTRQYTQAFNGDVPIFNSDVSSKTSCCGFLSNTRGLYVTKGLRYATSVRYTFEVSQVISVLLARRYQIIGYIKNRSFPVVFS